MLLCRLLCRRIFGMDVLTMSGTVTGNMTPPPELSAATAFSLMRGSSSAISQCIRLRS